MQARTQSQLNQIDRLVRTYEKTDGAEEKHQILAHIVVLGSFIKRRKDFVLSIDSAPVISEKKLTRAQAVAFLWRAAGSPTPESSGMPFTDVAADAYYHDAVLWAVAKGITKGMAADSFGPDASCTRAQIVSFLYRCMK